MQPGNHAKGTSPVRPGPPSLMFRPVRTRLLTKAAAVECAKLNYGIRVNSVHPGMVNTEMGAKVLKDFLKLGLVPDVATAEAAFEAAHLLGRGRPQDIANGVFYLASDASRWITGTELVVDGGFAVA